MQQCLALHGCKPLKFATGLWLYDASKVMLTLIVDNFSVKHIVKENALHLIKAHKDKCEEVEVKWDSSKSCGINL